MTGFKISALLTYFICIIYLKQLFKAMSRSYIPRRAEFEKLGKEYARTCVAKKNDAAAEAEAWLAECKEKEDLEIISKRDEREERTLAIAEKALSIATEELTIAKDSAISASRQARWAMWAAILSTVAAIITVKEQICEFIKLILQ